MSDVSFSSGVPETVLDPEPDELLGALDDAVAAGDRDAVAAVAAASPRSLEAWSRLGELGRDDVEAYAYFRVGYHRGEIMAQVVRNGAGRSAERRDSFRFNLPLLRCQQFTSHLRESGAQLRDFSGSFRLDGISVVSRRKRAHSGN